MVKFNIRHYVINPTNYQKIPFKCISINMLQLCVNVVVTQASHTNKYALPLHARIYVLTLQLEGTNIHHKPQSLAHKLWGLDPQPQKFRFLLTCYVDLIWRSTTVATASWSNAEGTLQLLHVQ